MLFSKEHLTGVYTWAPCTEIAVFDGEPSRRSFDRWNGDQVLYIIDYVLQSTGDRGLKVVASWLLMLVLSHLA